MNSLTTITTTRKELHDLWDALAEARIYQGLELKRTLKVLGKDSICTKHEWARYKKYLEQENKVKRLLYPSLYH